MQEHNQTTDVCICEFGATPGQGGLQTGPIQEAIDRCAEAGGGIVRVPHGVFRTGGLHLRSHVELHLEEGAILRGSEDCADYGRRCHWTDGLLRGEDLEEIAIAGKGTLDGANCRNAQGEEGFRGPHCVWLQNCAGIRVEDITIVRSANYAFSIVDSSAATFENLKVRAGHDGIHAQRSQSFRVLDCDFRTGDDCIAGQGNRDFEVRNCRLNTSCNGFRFSCVGLTVSNCRFWGPGEAEHRVSGRHNMLSAFIHFSPRDRGCEGSVPHSDGWLIENCTVENVDRLYVYDYENGGWQQGQPVAAVTFRDVSVTGALLPVEVRGDAGHQFALTMEDVDIALRDTADAVPLISISQFDTLTLRNVILHGHGTHPVLRLRDGSHTQLNAVRGPTGGPIHSDIDAVRSVH